MPGYPGYLGSLLAHHRGGFDSHLLVEAIMNPIIKAVREERDAAQKRLSALEHSLQTAMDLTVRGALKDSCPAHLYFGSCDCGESPTGECVYDGLKKSGMDDCLFCHGR
jgi:hypothetical protein